jgi:hypothetical protein
VLRSQRRTKPLPFADTVKVARAEVRPTLEACGVDMDAWDPT